MQLKQHEKKWHMVFIGYYFSIILVPFIAIITLCLFSANSLKKEAIKINKMVIDQLQQTIDTRLLNFKDFIVYIQNSSEFQNILYMNENLSAQDRYDLVQFSNKFIDNSLADSLIENYLIYLPKQRLMINSIQYKSLSDITPETFTKFFTHLPNYGYTLDQYYQHEILPIYKDNTTEIDSILYINSMHSVKRATVGVQFIIKLDITALKQIVDEDALTQQDTYFLILDREKNTTIYCSNSEIQSLLQTSDYTTYLNLDFITLDNKEYYIYRVSSDVTNVDFMVLMNSNKIIENSNKINLITFFIILIVIISTILIFRFIRIREFDTVATTVSMLNNNNNKTLDDYNAFRFIQSTVSQLLIDKKALEETVENSKEYLKNYFLIRLLTQKITDRHNYTKLIDYHNISFPYRKYRIMIFHKNSDESNLLLERITQALRSTLIEAVVIHSIYLDGMLVLILNYDFSSLDSSELIDFMKQYQTKLCENKITTALSSRKDSYFDLNQAYLETLEALEQCLLEGTLFKTYMPQIPRQYIEHTRYYQFEANFQSALEEKNYKNAETILSTMFSVLRKTSSMNSIMIKCKLCGIINTLTNIIIQHGESNIDIHHIYEILAKKYSIDELMVEIEKILHQLVKNSLIINTDKFISQVHKYMEEHYLERDLSVGMIADQFNVDISVLSKRFKKERNINISDHIHILRIQYSKHLLKTSQLTIREIAEQCGYLTSDMYIRVFKRYEGITPGKFRSSQK